ncbi:MAG: AAA family ATPase [Kiritimatiellae bacterium]|nr:AAA family ATPase [Kiritimatiellia bacterium]
MTRQTYTSQIYRLSNAAEYRKAGAKDLIGLAPAPQSNPVFVRKQTLEALAFGILHRKITHVSGPTGTAKTATLDALQHNPENWRDICRRLGFPERPLRMFAVQFTVFSEPGELFFRRAIRSGTTYDEESPLVAAIRAAQTNNDDCYHVIWVKEIGRAPSTAVQGGLLELLPRTGWVALPDGTRLATGHIAVLADSNYQAQEDYNHNLVQLDDALNGRFGIHITMAYLDEKEEILILKQLAKEGYSPPSNPNLIELIVQLGQKIRKQRLEGALQSVAPPTIYSYLSFLEMAAALPHHTPQELALATLLGNASMEDQNACLAIFNEVFALRERQEEDSVTAGGRLL